MHGITSMTHLPDYVTPQKAGEERVEGVWPTWAAASLVQQHTFQRNEKSLNWAFVDLTYISTVEMYVNCYRQTRAVPSRRSNGLAERKRTRPPGPGPLPNTNDPAGKTGVLPRTQN